MLAGLLPKLLSKLKTRWFRRGWARQLDSLTLLDLTMIWLTWMVNRHRSKEWWNIKVYSLRIILWSPFKRLYHRHTMLRLSSQWCKSKMITWKKCKLYHNNQSRATSTTLQTYSVTSIILEMRNARHFPCFRAGDWLRSPKDSNKSKSPYRRSSSRHPLNTLRMTLACLIERKSSWPNS